MKGWPVEQSRTVPDGYPHRLSDDELASAIERLMNKSIIAQGTGHLVNWSADAQLAVIQAGLQEQSRRETLRAEQATRRTTRLALAVSVLALLVALVSGLADYVGDKSWHDDQLRLLTQIRDRLDP